MARIDHDIFAAGGIAFYSPTVSVFALSSGGDPPSPPTIENVTPAAGTAIGTTTPVGFDVVDAELRRVLVKASFAGSDAWELVYDGTAFAPAYAAGSMVTSFAGGLRFRVLRAGGWPSAPTLTPFAFDASGAES